MDRADGSGGDEISASLGGRGVAGVSGAGEAIQIFARIPGAPGARGADARRAAAGDRAATLLCAVPELQIPRGGTSDLRGNRSLLPKAACAAVAETRIDRAAPQSSGSTNQTIADTRGNQRQSGAVA